MPKARVNVNPFSCAARMDNVHSAVSFRHGIQRSSARIPKVSPMRRLNYGWLVVAAAFWATGLTIGTGQYAFGVFVEPLEEEFGWTRTQINAVLSFSAVAALSGPFVGRIMDQVGTRPVMAFSLALLGLSYALRPFMTQLWHWYALGIVQALGFPGATILPAGKLVGLWFERTRGRMMGLATMGNNFGGLTMAPLAGLVVGMAGWRWGYGVFALLVVVSVPIVYLIVRDRPADVPREPGRREERGPREQVSPSPSRNPALGGITVGEALRTRAFYAVTLGVVAASFSYSGVLTQLIPHLQNEGVSLAQASLALSLLAGFGMVGKLLFGLLAERIPARFALMLSLAIQVVGLMMLVTWANTPWLWAFMPFYGVAFGAVGALMPLLVQETFGIRYFGTVLGAVNMATIVSIIVGPLMVGAFFDATESYRLAFLTVATIFAAGALILTLARPPRRLATG